MEIVTKIAPLGLALIMLGLGMSLTIKDFARVIKFPKDFFVGFICQMLVLPIIAFILIKLLNTPIELALGVMIIAAAPGGVTSNILTKFANGDVALSISLTAIISLISIFQFKKRTNQLFIGNVMYLFLLLIHGSVFYDTFNIFAVLTASGQSVTIGYGAGLFLTVASFPFVFLANRAIKKDEKLVRESDRLR